MRARVMTPDTLVPVVRVRAVVYGENEIYMYIHVHVYTVKPYSTALVY